MSTISHTSTATTNVPVPPALQPLEQGDHLDQPTFHARYEAMPPDTRAELIGGIVYMPSPAKLPHGKYQRKVSMWLDSYEEQTPGVFGGDGVTAILAKDSEPQPDSCLFLPADKGGQAKISDDEYPTGPPELIVEIASSTESYDLHSKKRDYERAGVLEYVVVAIRKQEIFWFVREGDTFAELPLGDDGIYRSRVFPGLWLDPAALLRLDSKQLRAVLDAGCATDEHEKFVEKLAN